MWNLLHRRRKISKIGGGCDMSRRGRHTHNVQYDLFSTTFTSKTGIYLGEPIPTALLWEYTPPPGQVAGRPLWVLFFPRHGTLVWPCVRTQHWNRLLAKPPRSRTAPHPLRLVEGSLNISMHRFHVAEFRVLPTTQVVTYSGVVNMFSSQIAINTLSLT